ncbi:MAG: cytochrome c [Campylobacterales bacterium]|nr:cytochrome c [Campylobacterales bacterium]
MIKQMIKNTLVLSALITSLYATSSDLIKQGEEVAVAGDCYACHTSGDGQQYGGGVSFPTPFGVVYSKNISPDKENGIGSYTYEEFSRAVRQGVSKRGNLYPAMPYDSFHLVTDDDTKALYAYFKSIPAVSQKNKDDEIFFPFNIRFGLKAWNLINLSSDTWKKDPKKSDDYNRGDYLTNSLGHCASCHTPRDLTMALDKSKHLEGNFIAGTMAPNISSKELLRQGWTQDSIIAILKHGYSTRGTILGHMTPITYHSLSNLNEKDLNAMAVYLLNSDKKVEEKPLTFNKHNKKDPGFALYAGYCASCHGMNGQGIPNTAPAMAGNGTLNQEKPLNTIYTLLYGIKIQRYSQVNAFPAMPSYNFTDEELTDLVNYLQNTFTDLNKTYTQKEIIEFKEEVISGAH